MAGLISELRRRNVVRVTVAYVVLAWLLLQVGDVLFGLMALPDVALRILLGLLLMGIVPAIVFSWVFEFTPEGLKRESQLSPGRAGNPRAARKLDLLTITMVVIALAVFAADRFLLPTPDPARPMASSPGPASESTAAPATLIADVASVAVLPFLNLSPAANDAYFADGLADTLLHRLTQVPDLRVAARTSSFRFRDHEVDVREIGRQLGVGSILEGSVQRQGERVRVTAQLINADTGIHLWSKVFDNTMEDIFAVQDEIAFSVTEALSATLLNSGTTDEVEAGGTRNVNAYQAYLRGLQANDRGTPQSVEEAVTQFERATELDPNYALAWAELSFAHYRRASVGSLAWEATYPPARAAAERAMALAPQLPDSLMAMAEAHRVAGQVALADEMIRTAYRLAPNNAWVVSSIAELESRGGDLRAALRLTQHAVMLDPLNHDLRMRLAWRKLVLGDVQDALDTARPLVEEDPNDVDIRADFADMLMNAGQVVQGEITFRQILDSDPDYLRAMFRLSFFYLLIGAEDRGDALLRRIEALAPDRAYDDRMEFCLLSGQQDCAEIASRRYLQYLQQADPGGETVAVATAMQSARSGQWRDVAANLSPLIEKADGTLDVDYRREALVLALAYQELGDSQRAGALLDAVEEHVGQRLAGGGWARWFDSSLAQIAVLRADPTLALQHLGVNLEDTGMPVYSKEVLSDLILSKLGGEPGFDSLIQGLRQRERQWLEAVESNLSGAAPVTN